MAVDLIETDDSMFHTIDGSPEHWWLLDLGEMRDIHEVQILTRQGCCYERFFDIEVSSG